MAAEYAAGLRLHHCHQTRSARVLWMLYELDVPFDLVLYPLDKSLRDPAFLSLSPAGRVPCLEINGDIMWESLAILQLLCDRFPERGLGRDRADPDRPEWLTWLHFSETMAQHVAALLQGHLVLREGWMRSPTVLRLEAMRLGKCLAALEARLSTPVENRDHVLTSGFSAADIALAVTVDMAQHFVALDPFPETAAWLERLAERPAFRATEPPAGAALLAPGSFYPPPVLDVPDARAPTPDTASWPDQA